MTEVRLLIGICVVSDRASVGVYGPVGGEAIEQYLRERVVTPWRSLHRTIPDGFENVREALIGLADREECALILTTGGAGSAPRDLTPEATEAACTRMVPGFGELMRTQSLKEVPTAILSRQTRGHPRQRIDRQPARPAEFHLNLSRCGVSCHSLLS